MRGLDEAKYGQQLTVCLLDNAHLRQLTLTPAGFKAAALQHSHTYCARSSKAQAPNSVILTSKASHKADRSCLQPSRNIQSLVMPQLELLLTVTPAGAGAAVPP
jgi:hypothetical protein